MSRFDDFTSEIVAGSVVLAQEIFDDYEVLAKQDTQDFIDKLNIDLRRWVESLEKGRITGSDFADLVQAKKALFEMPSLMREGVTLIRLERFRSKLINFLVEKAFEFFL